MNTHARRSADIDGECFAFVIPVVHPLGSKVTDYTTVETLLEKTVSSLLKQTHRNVAVIVVCHGAPDWAVGFDDRVRFLDVSNEDVFSADQHHVTIDKGLKYAIGVLYAMAAFKPKLIMLLDGDDYVHVELADRLLSTYVGDEDFDGYMIDKGVHVGVRVDERQEVSYRFAVEVKEFDFSCGSCRIFHADRLRQRLSAIDPAIWDRFSDWPEPDERQSLQASHERVRWISEITEDTRDERGHIVNLMGRHDGQKGYFDFHYLDLIGAAKGCGHGNHDGPRKGAIHWYRVTRTMPLRKFLATFGLPPQNWSFPFLSMLRTRMADKRAGNMWTD